MPPKQSDDPMELGDLDPMRIAEAVESKKVKPKPPPTELERKKEERLSAKEHLSQLCSAQVPLQTPASDI